MMSYEEALRAYVLQKRKVFVDSVHVYGICDDCYNVTAEISYLTSSGEYDSIDIEDISELLEDLFRLAGG